jgi:hypothetical protein
MLAKRLPAVPNAYPPLSSRSYITCHTIANALLVCLLLLQQYHDQGTVTFKYVVQEALHRLTKLDDAKFEQILQEHMIE